MLTAKTITAEARAIAEHDGLDQVSMRELAHRLRCTPRALYRHVATKEAVLELVADSAFADLPRPQADLPWGEAYLEFFVAMRTLLVAAPAIALAQFTRGASLPGTGDALFDVHRRLGSRPADADVPTLQQRAPGFPTHPAEHHFRSALRHLLAGYAMVDGAGPR